MASSPPARLFASVVLLALAFLLVVLPSLASAGEFARAAIIADSGTGVQTACVNFSGSASAAELLAQSGLGPEFADYGDMGKAVCKLGATGCNATSCFCSSSYWAFYYARNGSWVSSDVGVSFHNATDGEVLGFRWTSAMPAEEPAWVNFSEACEPMESTASEVTPQPPANMTRQPPTNATSQSPTVQSAPPGSASSEQQNSSAFNDFLQAASDFFASIGRFISGLFNWK
ncbi:Uncharacterised protein [Candidatus Burarchaeum australiense]|nr:Uncharacterised protein [Candidatus Burarchaeum australiense]